MIKLIILLNCFYLICARKATETEQSEIITYHNDGRKGVSPTASNMLEMQYDDGMANLAETWAQYCKFEHPQKGDSRFQGTGQNLALTYGNTKIDFNIAMEGWYKEKTDYNFYQNSCQRHKQCGHYTQMVWATSRGVGCAVKQCDGHFSSMPKPVYLYVCQYKPPGNYIGQRPYEQGPSCQNCPTGTKCRDKLCSSGALTGHKPGLGTNRPTPPIPLKPIGGVTVPGAKVKNEMTSWLNKHRANVSPKAADMIRTQYSNNLASLASKVAGRCPTGTFGSGEFPFLKEKGITLAYFEGTHVLYTKVLEHWWNETLKYTYDANHCMGTGTISTECRNYLQLAWYFLKSFGCYASECQRFQTYRKYFVVCLYDQKADTSKRPYKRYTYGPECPHGYHFDGQLCSRSGFN